MGFVTGDAPQPGEMPRNEGEPFSYTDPNTAWWRGDIEPETTEELAGTGATRPRHPRRRSAPTTPPGAPANLPPAHGGAKPAFAPEALDAHAAGVQDAARALEPPPAVLVEAEQEGTISDVEAAAVRAIADRQGPAPTPAGDPPRAAPPPP